MDIKGVTSALLITELKENKTWIKTTLSTERKG